MSESKPNKKKKYQSPRLVKYGDFKKLTLGIRQTRIETGGAGTNKTRISMSS